MEARKDVATMIMISGDNPTTATAATMMSECFWKKSDHCASSFTYKSSNYYGCVTNQHDTTNAWCSEKEAFDGKWHHCSWECPEEFKSPQDGGKWSKKRNKRHSSSSSKDGKADRAPTTTAAPQAAAPNAKVSNHQSPAPSHASKEDSRPSAHSRRLELVAPEEKRSEHTGEVSSVMVTFNPEAVIYKVDKALLHALVKRGAFEGLADGREDQLGEVHISGFKLHHPNGLVEYDDLSEDEELEQQADFTALPAPTIGCIVAVAVVGFAAVRFGLQSRGSQQMKYEQVDRHPNGGECS